MSEVSIKEVNLTDDLRKAKKERRSEIDRRSEEPQGYEKSERRKEERRKILRRQEDVDSILQ